jgi:hypothetical protein
MQTKSKQGITFHPSSVDAEIIKGKSENLLMDNEAYKQNKTSGPIFKSSCVNNEEHLIQSNGLVSLLTKAYCYHHKIVLRPEDIWLAIQSQFTIYVNKYSEDLRTVFVKHEGKQELIVQDIEVMSQDLSIMSIKMVDKMKEHLEDENLVNWVLPNFSTTTHKDTSIFAMLMMGTLKNYFDYRFELMCGLPEVTLLGTVEDWVDIRKRACELSRYEIPEVFIPELKNGGHYMSKWLDLLIPVLDKFVETSQGSPDLKWWNKVCHKYSGGSGPRYLTGWVTVFNVFANDGKWLADKRSDSWRNVANSPWPLVDTNDISYGFTSFNVTIDNNGDEFKAHMYVGCMGANVENGNTIIPRMDWGVVREIDYEENQRIKNAIKEQSLKKYNEEKEKERKLFIEKNKAKIEEGNRILAESSYNDPYNALSNFTTYSPFSNF